MLIFLTLVGVYFSLRLKGLQFRYFFRAAHLAYRYRTGEGEGNISPLQSLFAALGGIIGNGNLGGVATAIAIGGPGAVFWIWPVPRSVLEPSSAAKAVASSYVLMSFASAPKVA